MLIKSASYLLKEVDPDLWMQLKHRAVDERTTIKEILIKAIKLYLSKKP